jgi:hypothetical protein
MNSLMLMNLQGVPRANVIPVYALDPHQTFAINPSFQHLLMVDGLGQLILN